MLYGAGNFNDRAGNFMMEHFSLVMEQLHHKTPWPVGEIPELLEYTCEAEVLFGLCIMSIMLHIISITGKFHL